MNLARVEEIAKAVLYEGYMLYPYRPSSVKNRQRFNFGVVYPKSYCDAQDGSDTFCIQTECLIQGSASSRFEAKLRFLHLQTKVTELDPGSRNFGETLRQAQGRLGGSPEWQEAVERTVTLPEVTIGELCQTPLSRTFVFPEADARQGDWQSAHVEGLIEASGREVARDFFCVRLTVRNTTTLPTQESDRNAALVQSLVSAHAILGANGGAFVSLLEPAEELKEFAASCANVGLWPVLVGEAGECDTMLASPIILYDYPQIAPESAGDLFDGTEIDEILSLRIMTLTEEEKKEIRQSGERARQILERTEAMPAEQFMKLHGAVRSLRPLKENAS